MGNLFVHTLTVFITFLALYNPVYNSAVFFSLSSRKDRHERKKIAVKSVSAAFAILAVFCIVGKSIFDSVAIPVSSFKVLGGFFLIVIGIQMLFRDHRDSGSKNNTEYEKEKDIAVYPLAFPLMAGPGAISAAVVFSVTDSFAKIVINIISLVLISVITYYCFRSIYKYGKRLNWRLLVMTTRVMAVIVIFAGNALIINGLQGS